MSLTKLAASAPSPAALDEMVRQLWAMQARHLAKSSELKYPETHGTPEEQQYIAKSWRLMREQQAEIHTLVNSWTRSQQEAVLKHRLPPGSEVTLQLTEGWLRSLIIWRPARVLEAQRLKESFKDRLSPHQVQMVEEEGDNYWLRLAQSYQGND